MPRRVLLVIEAGRGLLGQLLANVRLGGLGPSLLLDRVLLG